MRAPPFREEESQSLQSFPQRARRGQPVLAALARTKRAVAPNGTQAIADARNLLSALDTVMLTRTAARRRRHVATAAPSEPSRHSSRCSTASRRHIAGGRHLSCPNALCSSGSRNRDCITTPAATTGDEKGALRAGRGGVRRRGRTAGLARGRRAGPRRVRDWARWSWRSAPRDPARCFTAATAYLRLSSRRSRACGRLIWRRLPASRRRLSGRCGRSRRAT